MAIIKRISDKKQTSLVTKMKIQSGPLSILFLVQKFIEDTKGGIL